MVTAVPAVQLHRVGKLTRARRWIVRDVTLDFTDKEFVTLLGPAGSGKTSLLMMLAGSDHPDVGTIERAGTRTATAGKSNTVALVPRHLGLFPNLSVVDNIVFPLVSTGRFGPADRRARAAELLGLLELDMVLDLPLGRLSEAQLVRLALARALITGPKLLLLDDPFAALAESDRRSLLVLLRTLHRRMDLTSVLATRDPAIAFMVSDRIAVLHAGRLVQAAPPADVYDRPVNLLVARLMGENNQLSGQIVAADDDTTQVRLSAGWVVEAERAEDSEVGAACVVSIRPERIAVAAVAAAEFGEHAVPARVLEVRYAGDHWRVQLSILPQAGCTAAALVVKRPPAALPFGLVSGRDVAIGWQSVHARILPAEPC